MKTIIREILAMIVIISAIALIITLVFFDYIKAEANEAEAAIYETSREESSILKEKKAYDERKDTLVLSSGYSIDAEELSNLKASGEFQQGQSSPFDETPITDILYDKEGNVYYQTHDAAATQTTSSTSSSTSNDNSSNSGNTTDNTSNNSNSNSSSSNNSNSNSNKNNTNDNSNSSESTNSNNSSESKPVSPFDTDTSTSSPSSGSVQTTQKTSGGK